MHYYFAHIFKKYLDYPLNIFTIFHLLYLLIPLNQGETAAESQGGGIRGRSGGGMTPPTMRGITRRRTDLGRDGTTRWRMWWRKPDRELRRRRRINGWTSLQRRLCSLIHPHMTHMASGSRRVNMWMVAGGMRPVSFIRPLTSWFSMV